LGDFFTKSSGHPAWRSALKSGQTISTQRFESEFFSKFFFPQKNTTAAKFLFFDKLDEVGHRSEGCELLKAEF
jgi:hypothetical protein